MLIRQRSETVDRFIRLVAGSRQWSISVSGTGRRLDEACTVHLLIHILIREIINARVVQGLLGQGFVQGCYYLSLVIFKLEGGRLGMAIL